MVSPQGLASKDADSEAFLHKCYTFNLKFDKASYWGTSCAPSDTRSVPARKFSDEDDTYQTNRRSVSTFERLLHVHNRIRPLLISLNNILSAGKVAHVPDEFASNSCENPSLLVKREICFDFFQIFSRE